MTTEVAANTSFKKVQETLKKNISKAQDANLIPCEGSGTYGLPKRFVVWE